MEHHHSSVCSQPPLLGLKKRYLNFDNINEGREAREADLLGQDKVYVCSKMERHHLEIFVCLQSPHFDAFSIML